MARQVPPDLGAAAQVHAVRQQVLCAVGRLAAQPLDVAAAEQMRAALAQVDSPEVRTALRELLPHGERPALRIVDGDTAPGPPATLRSRESAASMPPRPVITGGVA